MSIKIYSGFRFPTKMLHQTGFITSMRTAMYDVLADQIQERWKAVAEEIVKNKDKNKDKTYWADGLVNAETDSQRMFYVLEWVLAQKNFIDAYRSTIVLFPNKVWCLGWIAANGGIESLIYKNLMSIPGIEEYGYWDNTDRLETVTNAEWATRRKLWLNHLDSDRLFLDGVGAENTVNVSMYIQEKLHIGWYDQSRQQ